MFGIRRGRRKKNLAQGSQVDPDVWQHFTPEGKDLVRRVLASTNMTIKVQEGRRPTFPPVSTTGADPS